MLHFFNDYLIAKKLRYRLIPSRDIDNQRILQSNWMRSTIGHTKPKLKDLSDRSISFREIEDHSENFPQNEKFFEKLGFVNFWTLGLSNFNFRKIL